MHESRVRVGWTAFLDWTPRGIFLPLTSIFLIWHENIRIVNCVVIHALVTHHSAGSRRGLALAVR